MVTPNLHQAFNSLMYSSFSLPRTIGLLPCVLPEGKGGLKTMTDTCLSRESDSFRKAVWEFAKETLGAHAGMTRRIASTLSPSRRW